MKLDTKGMVWFHLHEMSIIDKSIEIISRLVIEEAGAGMGWR